MRNIVFYISFIVLLLMMPSQLFASEQEKEEWIVYFQDSDALQSFLLTSPSVVDVFDRYVLIESTDDQIESVKKYPGVLHVEKNHKKSAAVVSSSGRNSMNDWAHEQINLPKATAQNQPINMLEEATIITSTSDTLTINLPTPTELTRLSVEINNVENLEWHLQVLTNTGEELASNSGELNKLDVLLPKQHYTELKLKVWFSNDEATPDITNLYATNAVKVAVIDSGISTHDQFCGNVLYSLTKDYTKSTETRYDEFGHGTHVTGILAACGESSSLGVIKNAPIDIVPLKVLDKYGNGGDFELSKAIFDAIEAEVDVINLSLAGKGETYILRNAVNKAISKGIVVVAAAGNWETSTASVYPASYPGVITVAATSKTKERLTVSNYGWEVDISAPGENILSTYLNNGNLVMTGTSMATPYVTGAVALLKLSNPKADLAFIRNAIFQTALDIDKRGYDIYTGAGILQVADVLAYTGKAGLDWLTWKDQQRMELLSSEQLLTISESGRLLFYVDDVLVHEKSLEQGTHRITFDFIRPFSGQKTIKTLLVNENKEVIAMDRRRLRLDEGKREANFRDVSSNHWASEEIRAAFELGFVNGFSNGREFKPEAKITRKHTVMMLDRLFEWKVNGTLVSPFHDVDVSKSSSISILSAFHNGMIKGLNGSFYPDNEITRAQAALIFARALQFDGMDYTSTAHHFSDLERENFAYDAVQHLAAHGIIMKQDKFRPYEPITRAQLTAMINRTYHYLEMNRELLQGHTVEGKSAYGFFYLESWLATPVTLATVLKSDKSVQKKILEYHKKNLEYHKFFLAHHKFFLEPHKNLPNF